MDTIDKINAILKVRGMSGADLSRKIGVSTAVYSQWNRKKTKPSNKNLVKVAEVLEVSIAELTRKEQNENLLAQNEEISEKDIRLVKWFRSLPPEKQKAILISQDAPEELAD